MPPTTGSERYGRTFWDTRRRTKATRAVDWLRVGVACVLADSKATPGPPLPLDGVLVRSLCAVHRLHFAGYRAAIGTSVTAVIAGRERVARGAQAARDAAHWFPRS
jgi:hypothetical protein